MPYFWLEAAKNYRQLPKQGYFTVQLNMTGKGMNKWNRYAMN
jgi:hypothetical protein